MLILEKREEQSEVSGCVVIKYMANLILEHGTKKGRNAVPNDT